MWFSAGIVGVLVAAWSVWRWTTLPEAGIATMGFATFLLAVVGIFDERLKNLMREVQELRRERQSSQPKTDN
jgi:hypothetical membrane protein